MIDSFENIPSHPLLVHVPVVLVPLSMVATVLMVVVPLFRRRYGSLAIAVLGLASAGAVLAARSGRTLEKSLTDAGRTIPDLLQEHVDTGQRLQFLIGLYLLLTVVWLVRSRRFDSNSGGDEPFVNQTRMVTVLLVVATLTAGAFSTVSTLRTAQSGARSVWEQVSDE